MSERPALLLARLDAIATALRDSAHALALIALGSTGLETERLDEWSDLDFLVVVEAGHKRHYLERLDWLEAVHPVAWHYRRTFDGHRALMADGIFCEFAVFEPQELDAVPFTPGRLVWRRDGVDPSIATPRKPLPAPRTTTDEAWLVGEALSSLLVGLRHWHRGEKLSAMRLVQIDALDRLLELDALRRHVPVGDPFNPARRVEVRQPALAAELSRLAPGYGHSPEAALAVLEALASLGTPLNVTIAERIRMVAGQRMQVDPSRSK